MTAAKKQRTHNEWFRPLVKRVCECGRKKVEVWAWGEYHAARWRTILHFCEECFATRVKLVLTNHVKQCGCDVALRAKSGSGPLPEWIKIVDGVCELVFSEAEAKHAAQ